MTFEHPKNQLNGRPNLTNG